MMGPEAALSTQVVLASSGEGGSALFGLILFALPFVIGWFVYTRLYKRYRNQDKRYLFEHTTTAERSNLQRWDDFERTKNRQRSSTIDGRNEDEPLQRTAHSVVREAMPAREAQAERTAQEARLAQEPRDAQEAREAAPAREAGGDSPDGPAASTGSEPHPRPPA